MVIFFSNKFYDSYYSNSLRTEFVHCVEELQNEIEKNTSLSSEIFSETVQRFYKLTNILHKADNILSPIIGLNITICMVMLCGVVYKCLVGNCNFAQWNLPTITPVVILIILLPPVIATNNKVVNGPKYTVPLASTQAVYKAPHSTVRREQNGEHSSSSRKSQSVRLEHSTVEPVAASCTYASAINASKCIQCIHCVQT